MISDDYSLHYIVVMYIGPKRNYSSYQKKFSTDPLYFSKIHLNFLKKCSNHISKVTFVFNSDIDGSLKEEIKATHLLDNMDSEIVFYGGLGYSYGAWNEVIKRNLEKYDYHFLIEDDYIPTRTDFYKPFVERTNDEFPYVCSYVELKEDGRLCASTANAVVKDTACSFIYKKYGDVFAELNAKNLPSAWHTQLNFLNYFTENNLGMKDILDGYCTPHMLNCRINQIVYFGDKSSPVLIEPIVLEIP